MWLALSLLVALPLVWVGAGKLHRFAYWIDRKTDAEIEALATGGWRQDRLEVAPGIVLAGLVRPPASPDARWILFVPGNSTALLAGFRAELDALRGEADVGMALWAYRGFEASGGVPVPEALEQDLLRQWDHVKQLGARPNKIELWGYSLGSVLAVRLAAALADRGETPARLVLAAAGEQIPIMQHGLLGRFQPDDVYDAVEAIPRVRCPTVIVHGTADDALPIEGARRLAMLLGDRATLHELPGKGHTDLWADLRRLAF